MIGQRFGRLIVIERAASDKHRNSKWRCKCDCGNETIVLGFNLKNQNTESCGCLHKKHGLYNHPLYAVYHSMKGRCENQNNSDYDRYGGRGIKVCDEWRNDLKKFYDWCIKNEWNKGLEIDRIDNDGNYCPENCRFVTTLENSHNRTLLRNDNKTGYVGISYDRAAGKYRSRIQSVLSPLNGKSRNFGYFEAIEEAVIVRDKFIIENNLPYELQILAKEKNEQ